MLNYKRLLPLLMTTATLATIFSSGVDATSNAVTPAPTPSLVSIFAPSGTLRASINLGNPILANLDPATGKPVGVSVDLATELAKRLGVPLQLVAVPAAHLSVENVEQDKADVGFFAIDPKRGQAIQFTKPYVLIEGVYAVHNDSPIKSLEQVDQPGITVATSKGSAYDLFLTRELHHATIVRVATSQGVVQGFLDQKLNVASGIRQQLEKDAARLGNLRIIEPHFMVIRQAMGVPKAKGDEAAAYLSAFVEEMRSSDFVAASLARHHIEGAGVAQGDD